MKAANNGDFVFIRGLRLKCRIGVSPRERREKQVINADIALKCDLRRAGQSDRLMDTIDYSMVSKTVTVMAAKKTFCLLESLAKHIAGICLANSEIKQVTVKVAKKGVLPNVSSVEVEITRSRDFTICHSRPDRESGNSKTTGFPLGRE